MVCGAAGSKERDSVTTIDGGARHGAKTVFGEAAWHLAAWHLGAWHLAARVLCQDQ